MSDNINENSIDRSINLINKNNVELNIKDKDHDMSGSDNLNVERAIADTLKKFNLDSMAKKQPESADKNSKTVMSFNAQKFIKDFFGQIIGLLNLNCDVNIRFDGHIFYVGILGDKANVFIGKHGIILYSYQNILNVALKKYGLKVLLDAAGYREKRRGSLSRHALRSAQTVLRTGVKYIFEPMDSWDRIVVHEALMNVPGILSRTEGDNDSKYVVIELNLVKNREK